MSRVINICMKISLFELAYRFLYPALRRRIVEILHRDFKLNQLKIAELLHITQSAVSRYLHMNRGAILDLSRFPDIEQDMQKLAKKIVNEEPNEYLIHQEFTRILLKALGKGYICSFHKKIDKEVDPSLCRTCINLFRDFI